MTGRSDYGSHPWLFPALLSDAPSTTLRRGSQQDILRALRHLLARPAVGRQVTRPDATPLGTTAGPGEVSDL